MVIEYAVRGAHAKREELRKSGVAGYGPVSQVSALTTELVEFINDLSFFSELVCLRCAGYRWYLSWYRIRQ